MIRILGFVMAVLLFSGAGCSEKSNQSKNTFPQLPEVSDSEKEYDLFLLIGQSNMAGRGTMLPEDTEKPIDGVWLLNDKGEIEPAVNPLNKYSSIRKDLSMQQINPGYGFAKKIHESTGRKILLVVNARGGSSISQWNPDSKNYNFYAEAVRR